MEAEDVLNNESRREEKLYLRNGINRDACAVSRVWTIIGKVSPVRDP